MYPISTEGIFSETVNDGNSSWNPYPRLGKERDNADNEQIGGEAQW